MYLKNAEATINILLPVLLGQLKNISYFSRCSRNSASGVGFVFPVVIGQQIIGEPKSNMFIVDFKGRLGAL